MSEELKPCPHCGNDKLGTEQKTYGGFVFYKVFCNKCECNVNGFGDLRYPHKVREIARNLWNQRVDADIKLKVKKVNDLIQNCREEKNRALQEANSLKAVKIEGEMEGYRNIRYLLEHNLF